MKKLYHIFQGVALIMCAATSAGAKEACRDCFHNAANDIPVLNQPAAVEGWNKIEDVAQYKLADWNNVVGKAENVSLQEAQNIADNDPQITYFFYVKGGQMVLENLNVDPPIWRVFQHGEAVFFTGEPWWGTAPGLADGYVKQEMIQK